MALNGGEVYERIAILVPINIYNIHSTYSEARDLRRGEGGAHSPGRGTVIQAVFLLEGPEAWSSPASAHTRHVAVELAGEASTGAALHEGGVEVRRLEQFPSALIQL